MFLTGTEEKMANVALKQLNIIQRMNVPVLKAADLNKIGTASLIIDGIIGYSLSGRPKGTAREFIDWANRQAASVLSLDTPSGINLTIGIIRQPTILATATMTLALPKKGLFSSEARDFVGELYLADISVPPSLYAEQTIGIQIDNIFAGNEILRIN